MQYVKSLISECQLVLLIISFCEISDTGMIAESSITGMRWTQEKGAKSGTNKIFLHFAFSPDFPGSHFVAS